MLDKGMQKTWTVVQNGSKLGAEIEKKTVKNDVRKTMRKRAHMQDGSAACGGRLLKTYHLFSSRVSSRLSSRLGVFSRLGTSCHVSKFVSSARHLFSYHFWVFGRVLTSCNSPLTSCIICLYPVNVSLEAKVKSENVTEGLGHSMLIARSLKRPMLHTVSASRRMWI